MAWDKRDVVIRQKIAAAALALPGVGEYVQWGGWAYKLKGKKGPKLLAYVCDGKHHGWHAQFKLPGTSEAGRAAEVVKQYRWIEPHPWRTLGPAGWVVARPRDERQMKVLAGLLGESRELLPAVEAEAQVGAATSANAGGVSGATSGGGGASGVAAKIDRVMREAKEAGWRPRDEDAAAFDGVAGKRGKRSTRKK